MPFQFLPFNQLKNNFSELKDVLSADDNAEAIKQIDALIGELIASNSEERSNILTGALLSADLVISPAIPSSTKMSSWRLVDLDTETTPRQVTIPVTTVDIAIGVSKHNVLDEESRRSAMVAYEQHKAKPDEVKKAENKARANKFAAQRVGMFGPALGQARQDEAEVVYNFKKPARR